MNELNSLISAYEHHRQAQARLNEVNKGSVFDALAAANITEVHVDFDGEGDSGQINTVIASTGEDRTELPNSIAITIQRIYYGNTETFSTGCTLEEAIETLCYSYLGETHDGWENNDGAYGEFRLDVAKRTVELEFNGRFTDTYTNNHNF